MPKISILTVAMIVSLLASAIGSAKAKAKQKSLTNLTNAYNQGRISYSELLNTIAREYELAQQQKHALSAGLQNAIRNSQRRVMEAQFEKETTDAQQAQRRISDIEQEALNAERRYEDEKKKIENR